jgi:hypothetical protein
VVADGVTEVVVDRLESIEVDEQQRDRAVRATQACHRLAGAVHQQQAVGEFCERIVQRLALQPHAIRHVLRGRIPRLSVAACAPQQPPPRAVAVAVAVGEVDELGGPVVHRERQRERLLEVVRMHELLHRVCF